MRPAERKGRKMDWLIPLIILGAWILLQTVVLPKMGVPT
jgi:hypothetical protein